VWVVVGLGNPGQRYARTRHNVGFRVVDRLADRWGVSVAREAHAGLVGEGRRGAERVLLVKPQTWMNASGRVLASIDRFFHPPAGQVIVVHDDVDLPLGRLRMRIGGGAGGHRGIESCIAVMGPEFGRLKVGVGRPPAGWDTADWVLAAPAPEEAAALTAAEERTADAVDLVLHDGFARAMNRINQRENVDGGSPL
jgi:PTH1 family peptidyl-tRNA hydrolase